MVRRAFGSCTDRSGRILAGSHRRQIGGFSRSRFWRLLSSARAVSRGDTPYVVDEFGPLGSYVYGPALAFAMQPLASLDYIWACRLWTLFNWALTCGCLAMALSLAGVKDRRHLLLALWLAAIPTVSYFWSGIRVGQASILMVALCLGWAVCLRSGRSLTGGCLLAAATSLKLAPGFLIPYMLVRRDWRGLVGVCLGGISLVSASGALGRVRRLRAAASRMGRPLSQYASDRADFPARESVVDRPVDSTALGQQRSRVGLGRPACRHLSILSVGCIGPLRRCSRHHRLAAAARASPAQFEIRAIAILMVAMTLIHVRAWTCNFVALALPAAMLARRHRRAAVKGGEPRSSGSCC